VKAVGQVLDHLPEDRLKDLIVTVNDAHAPFDRLFLSQLHASLGNFGVEFSEIPVLSAGEQCETLEPAIAKLLALPTSAPHYVLTPQLHIAERMLTELLHLRQRVPGDYELISMVNSSRPDQPHNPRIRLFGLGTERLGPLALERLDQMIRHPEAPPSRTAIPPTGFLPFAAPA